MSVSKIPRYCEFCVKEPGIYVCPRCNSKYCSTKCYKSPNHSVCSESFYQEWVESTMRQHTFHEHEKQKMMHSLKKCEEEFSKDPLEELSIVDRFTGLNIDELEEGVLWQNLNNEEKKEFEALIDGASNLDFLIQLKEPWWMATTLNLVSDYDEEPLNKDEISVRPLYPLNVKKLSDLTTKAPSLCIQFNMIGILYVYAFLYRFYNCDVQDFVEEVTTSFFGLSPVLSEGHNYHSIEEAVQDSIRGIMNSDFGVTLDFAKSIISDVNSLLQGPINAKGSTFVLCTLHDIKCLLLETKNLSASRKDKCLRKKLMPAVKKIEYLMSWSLDFEKFSDLASDLLLLMLPELFSMTEKSVSKEDITKFEKKTPKIEIID